MNVTKEAPQYDTDDDDDDVHSTGDKCPLTAWYQWPVPAPAGEHQGYQDCQVPLPAAQQQSHLYA